MLGATENEQFLEKIEDTEAEWDFRPAPDEMSAVIEADAAGTVDPETGMPVDPEDLTRGAKI